MRINLITPLAGKDAAKALGARWDAAKKCWYIVDVADLTHFSRWIPNMDAAMNASGVSSAKPKFSLPTLAKAVAQSGIDVADCGCDVLPWDDCQHTIKT